MIPQLDLFKKKPVQACITGRHLEKVKPLSALPEKPDVIEFLSPGRPLHYLDINNLIFRVVVSLKREAGGDMAAATKDYSVVDVPLHSITSQCEIFLSEEPATKWPHLYNYKSVLDIYTTAGKDAREGPLSTVIVKPDKSGTDTGDDSAWAEREAIFNASQKVELMGRLRADICNLQDGAFVLDNVPLRVKMTLAPQSFYLWSKDANHTDVKMAFHDAELYVPYFVGNAEMAIGIDMALTQQPATYHYKSSQLKVFVHPIQTPNLTIPVAFSGKLPSTVMFAMVDAANYNGNVSANPYDFVHSGLQELTFLCNGTERRFLMNMDLAQGCSTVVHSMYADLGHDLEEAGGHLFNVESLKNGKFVCAVDLTIDHSGRMIQNLDRFGNIGIQGRFKTAPTRALCVILYAQYDSTMEISSSRQVSVY
ncbi:uncharacterized protein LOC117651239 [Thrips palmi]|uniref:Uncharacterized protein LOC117651239 n=1 Tax=Thrips palmi TaxID=161013 RepID=A0A6P8ZZS2_THRPL|nr:uncharacterized protein LOC117651239 [Thrips palmi]